MPEIVGRLRTPRLATAPASPANGEMYYNTATNKLMWWNGTAWIDASGGGGGMNLDYFGSYAPGTYNDGDIVIGSDGITYICVVDGTTTAPVPWTGVAGPAGPPGIQGPQGPQGVKGDTGATSPLVPAVQNGKWLTGIGGAAVWADITQSDLPVNLRASANAAPPLNKDLNNATANGWYGVSQDTDNLGPTQNRPPISYGEVAVINLSPGNLRQVCYEHQSLNIWQRYCAGGTWSAWIQTQFTDTGWILGVNFQNGWSSYDPNSYPPARSRRLASGLVVLSGLLKGGTTNTIAFTLGSTAHFPSDLYRHYGTMGNDGIGSIRISTGGTVQLSYPAGGWITLDGVCYWP